MDEDIATDWPDQEDDEVDTSSEPSTAAEEQTDDHDSVEDTTSPSASEDEVKPSTDWSFPIRAAPILALQGETVTEFPLSQHVSGRQSTSLIVDEKLMRIVESRYDEDGIRRLNVRMALVKEHISGYSHTHLDLFQRLMPIWTLSIAFGTIAWVLMFTKIPVIGGGIFILAGFAGMLLAKLDLHRISFSDHGGRHDFYLSGWRQNPFLIYNSTALLGPALVGFLQNRELETKHIDAIVTSMAQPIQAPPPPSTPKALPAPPKMNTPPMPLPTQPLPPPTPLPSVASGPPASTPKPEGIPAPPAPPQVIPINSLPPPPLPPPLSPAGGPENDPLWD